MSDKNTPDSSFSPQGNSNSNKPAADPNDDLVLFPLDEFTAAQKTRTPSSTPPSSFRKTTTQNTGQPAWRPQAAPPAPATGNRPNTSRIPWPQNIPKKTNSRLSSLFGYLIIIAFFLYTCSDLLSSDDSESSVETTSSTVTVGGVPEYYKIDKLQISLDSDDPRSLLRFQGNPYYFGNLILLEKTGKVRRRYILPANAERDFDEIGYVGKFPYETPVEEATSGSIDEMLSKRKNPNQKVLMQEYEGGGTFYVSLKAIEYYEEIGVRFMFDDISNYNNNQTEIVYMPLYLYELLETGSDIHIELKDIPTKKLIVKKQKKKNQ